MFYDSFRLFLDHFCEPTEASAAEGMEFLVDSIKLKQLTKLHHVWLTISPDFSTLHILMVYETRRGEFQLTEEVPIVQATVAKVIQIIEEMARECTLQD